MENSFIIENLLQQKESNRLAFKAQSSIDAIAKTITSFINTQGGDVIVGVDGEKKVIGVDNATQVAQEIQASLVEYIQPTAPIFVQVISYNKKDVILISVWEGGKKPYQYKGALYNRVGKSTKPTTPEQLTQLIAQRKKADFHWERMPVLGAELSDLDLEEVQKTLNRYKEYKSDIQNDDVEDFLIRLGLIQNGNITNACMVLFGKNPTQFVPQSRVRVTLYPSKTSGNQFLDDKVFEGNIFKNITAIFGYLENIYGKILTIKGVLREEKSNYPVMAFREGILNAIIHRDYNSVKGFLQISIYSDRTEISNYGVLPDGITIADLKIDHTSILRNPDIAQICFYRGYVELLGSGTQRMIRDCKQNQFKVPVWKQNDNSITVTFSGVTHSRKTEEIIEGITEGVSKRVIEKIEGITEGITEGTTEDVKEKLSKVLIALYKNEGLRTSEMEKMLQIPVKSLERYIKQLKDANLIEFKGANRTGGYFLTEKTAKTINT